MTSKVGRVLIKLESIRAVNRNKNLGRIEGTSEMESKSVRPFISQGLKIKELNLGMLILIAKMGTGRLKVGVRKSQSKTWKVHLSSKCYVTIE